VDDTADVVAAVRERFPNIDGPAREDICYATTNRQEAVKQLAEAADVVLVIGAPNSSNSNRLREVAEGLGRTAYLIERAEDIDLNWFVPGSRVGITAGASAPEVLVMELVERLKSMGAGPVRVLDGPEELVVFSLPEVLSRQ
jgi:4-hydroxy-3-methylbut-2-enyl diphosphate reductase